MCLFNFNVTQWHSKVKNRKLAYFFSRGITIFPGKINLKKVFEPFISPRIQEISVRAPIFSTNTLYISYLYKHASEFLSKRASQHTLRAYIDMP